MKKKSKQKVQSIGNSKVVLFIFKIILTSKASHLQESRVVALAELMLDFLHPSSMFTNSSKL